MDDKAALEDIRNGGQAGYKAIRARYEPRLRDYATKYLPKKFVEKVVQQVFAQFEKSMDNFKETDLSTWLYRETDYVIDEVALEDIRKGGREGYIILHNHYVTSLYNYVREKYHPTEESAKKVVEDVFVKFYQRLLEFKKSSGIKRWLYKMADRLAGDSWLFKRLPREGESCKEVQPQEYWYKYVTAKVPIESSNDVAQEVFLKFCKSILSFEGKSSLSTWVTKIAKSVVATHWQDEVRNKKVYPKKTLNENDEEVVIKSFKEDEIQAQNPLTISIVPPHREDDETDEEITLLFEFLNEKYGTEEHNRDIQRCVNEVKAHLERDGNLYLLNCLQVHILMSKGYLQEEIADRLGISHATMRVRMSTCRKKLIQYSPLQECLGIFLKMCLEQVKADLERQGSNDDDILMCLQAHILKLQGKATGEVAEQIGKKSRETKAYLSDCKKKLMQHSAIPKECRKWLKYLE
jgi:RNA polymerase sigma factor (sigma-70 family)